MGTTHSAFVTSLLASEPYASLLRDVSQAVAINRQSGAFVSLGVEDSRGVTVARTGRERISSFSDTSLHVRTVYRRHLRPFVLFEEFDRDRPITFTKRYIKVIRSYPLSGGVTFFFTIANVTYALKQFNASVVRSTVSVDRRGFSASSPLRPSPETETSTGPFYQLIINGSPPSVGTVSWESYRRTWTGVRTPGFGALKSKGQLPVNPHTVRICRTPKDSYISTDRWVDEAFNTFILVTRWSQLMTLPGEPTHNGEAYNRAVKRLQGKAGNQIDANLAQDFAQIGQTTRLIGNTAQRIVKSVSALRRGNISLAVDSLFAPKSARFRNRGGPSRSKDLASNWLELQYGWKPLLMDISGTMEASAKLIAANTSITSVTSSATNKLKESWPVYTPAWSGQPSPPRVMGNYTRESTTTVKIGLRYRIDDHLKSFLAQTGFTNPINLAWEILPFSFVYDWFHPIGPYLEALSAWDGLQFIDGYQVSFTKENVSGTASLSYNLGGNHLGYDNYGFWAREIVLLNRTKLTAFPNQTVPIFKNPFSVTHALNGIALLKAVFGR